MAESLEKLNAKLDEQGAKLDELEKKAARPHDGFADAPESERRREHREAFKRFITRGDTAALDELRTKDVQISVPGDGGYAVPEELDRNILKLMRDQSPMRQVCSQMTISGVAPRAPLPRAEYMPAACPHRSLRRLQFFVRMPPLPSCRCPRYPRCPQSKTE